MARLLDFPAPPTDTDTHSLRNLGWNLYLLGRANPAAVLVIARWVQFLLRVYTQSDEAS